MVEIGNTYQVYFCPKRQFIITKIFHGQKKAKTVDEGQERLEKLAMFSISAIDKLHFLHFDFELITLILDHCVLRRCMYVPCDDDGALLYRYIQYTLSCIAESWL